jgi:D-alanyl-lipoteichoic acid acyltransferase DltB (MBOAT superfamily)
VCAFSLGHFAVKAAFPYDGFGTEAFAAVWLHMLPRLCYLVVSVSQFRLRFYAAWSLMEASGLLLGLPRELVQNFKLREVETTFAFKDVVRGWNMSVARWYADVVYSRLPVRSRPLRMCVVMALSAWWHDTRPPMWRYYLAFAQFALYAMASEQACKHVYEPLLSRAGRAERLVRACIFVHERVCFAYFGIMFKAADAVDFCRQSAAWSYYGIYHLAAVGAIRLAQVAAGRIQPVAKRSD